MTYNISNYIDKPLPKDLFKVQIDKVLDTEFIELCKISKNNCFIELENSNNNRFEILLYIIHGLRQYDGRTRICFPDFVTFLKWPIGYEKDTNGYIEHALQLYQDTISYITEAMLILPYLAKTQPDLSQVYLIIKSDLDILKFKIEQLYKNFIDYFEIEE